MSYTAKDYSKLIGMEGFSETLLKNHFTLYQGYVTNTNKVLDTLAQMLKDDKASSPEFAELKRRLGWEFNGTAIQTVHQFFDAVLFRIGNDFIFRHCSTSLLAVAKIVRGFLR